MRSIGAANGSTYATRVYEFSASHRLQSDSLSEQENRDLFGKCNYPNGHGHNYVLEVTVAGPVDPITGRVINPDALDEIVNREVVERYDHRHLNLDIPEFAGVHPLFRGNYHKDLGTTGQTDPGAGATVSAAAAGDRKKLF